MPRVKSNADYIKKAAALSRFKPELKKYRKRKNLSPQEKAAITRAERAVQAVGGRIRAITEKQHKRLGTVHKLPYGIRGIVTNVDAEGGTDRLHIDKNGNPVQTVITKETKRRLRWHFIPVEPELGPLIDAGIEALENGATSVYISNTHGRAGGATRDAQAWINEVRRYFAQYENLNAWILGIVSLVQSKKN